MAEHNRPKDTPARTSVYGRSPGEDTLSVFATDPAHPYDALTPETILDAVETFGDRCTGALLALNSYENRVYRVNVDDGEPVVAKFYRPGRWTDAAILEEHAFAQLLADHEIPAVAPLIHTDGRTLHEHAGFRFALFPWARGRTPELNTADDRKLLGRYMGRLHLIGQAEPFQHRPRLTVEEYGRKSVALLAQTAFIPDELREPYFRVTEMLLPMLDEIFREVGDVAWIRSHGDCHLGNILWGANGPILVDFDDCLAAPAIQDLWMMLGAEREEMESTLADYLNGYVEFHDFDPTELRLIEPLRTLRMLRYGAWLASRWDDPAFPRSFPWFAARRYWEEQILALKQQLAALSEPPLIWRLV
ncbi:MAG: serine/threonine protein kinase [Gammaproteobacteria bacterium]|nr:serine/threonine protein kinase [Gammaproteobacteria bacterium]